ncbi:transcriptional regulator, LacI family [Tranquillimonas alkanivorans]|uniref:Transcriptional regulator, LacI family n=2 Tax=Tranquillimonas alkanivorans TaxID=441119 RepID=A0A1I5MD56_9RHOB|nr:transcriptional regulator, LacI family [Tranquillimonas alkanivorans]
MSKGTVSRALNNYADISPATRARVAQAAVELGYAPLAHAQAIRTGRARALGLVLQMEQHDAQRPFLAEFLRGITRAASARNWTLTVATAESEEEGLETYERLIAERKADGFILPRTRWHDPRVALLRAAGCPFVLFGRTADAEAEGCAWYDIRGGAAMQDAVRRLQGFGHRRIGFIGAAPEFTYARKRREGLHAALLKAGLPTDDVLFDEGNATSEDGLAAATRLLAGKPAPTALVCATDTLAVGAVRALRMQGLKPGRDVSVIGYDGAPEGRAADPPLTTYAVDQTAAGARLADILIALIDGTDPESLRETAEATLRPGGTDGPAPQSKRT